MQDRIPTPGQEGRVLITPENGSAPFFATVEMADNPTQEGTPLNKSTLLQDSICEILGIPNTSVPNDAFAKLALGIGKYGYVIHVQYPNGTPAEGFTISGISAPNGTTVITNEDGYAVGVSTDQSINIGIDSPFIDIASVSGMNIDSTGILTYSSVTVEPVSSEYVRIDTSKSFRFSPIAKTADFCGVGAGGGGANDINHYGAGGGGGEVVNVLHVDLDTVGRDFSVTIGAGGTSTQGSSPSSGRTNAGSTTVFSGDNQILTAQGGQNAWEMTGSSNSDPGDGWGRGASAMNDLPAQPNTVDLFDDHLLGKAGGGGGGVQNHPGASPYGADFDSQAKGPGGGGASFNDYDYEKGHDGGLYVRAKYT